MNEDVIRLGGIGVRYLVDGSATRSQGMFELTVQPQSPVPPPHSHTDNDEMIYVLDGALRCTLDGETRDLQAGDWASSPRGSVHGFSNPFDAPARALVMQSPDIGQQYFLDVMAAIPANGPPDREKLVAVMARYGLRPGVPA